MRSEHGALPMVRPRKRREIEAYADRLLLNIYPECAVKPQEVPVADFFEMILPELAGIITAVTDQLPPGIEGIASPSGTSGRPELLLSEAVYDALMDGQARARFTTAHECGHGIFHLREIQNQLVENAAPTLYRRQELPRYRNPEWHANVFAAAFLMPTAAVRALVDRYGADPYAMAETFGVSPRAADLRLHYMGLEVMTM